MRVRVILLVIFCMLIAAPFITQPHGLYQNENIKETNSWTVSYTESSPIVIEHDDNFTTLGFSGDGSETTPYIIDELNITSNLECIVVRNTRAYFEITNCYFAPELDDYSNGIVFENVTNAYVGSNIFFQKTTAIRWDNVNNSQCVENDIVGNVNSGVDLFNCYHCDVIQNNIQGNDDYRGSGIQLSSSYFCDITDNEVANSFSGISVASSQNCTIGLNQLHDFDVGSQASMGFPSAIEVGGSPHTFIIENTISDSPKGGIILNSPTSVECTNNVLIGCGFFLQGLVPGFPGFSTSGDLVNNKPILYIWNQTNLDVDGTSYSQVILHEAKFCTITNGEFNDASVGVYVSYSTNCTVQDAEVSGNHFAGVFQYISVNCTFDNLVLEDNSRFISPSTYTSALYMFMSQNTTITNCEITDSPFAGLLLGASQRATVSNNVFLRNGIYILGMGIPAAGDYFITEKDNLINGKQFGYFFNKTDLAIDGSLYGQLMIVNSSRLTVTGGDFSEATSGVSLILTENCTLEGATIKKNSLMGLQIVSSTNTSVINCAVDENPYVPVYTAYSESSTYLNNSICRNGHGLPENVASSILLAKSYDELGFNRISHNRFGIQLDGNYVVLHDNNITCNGLFGIFVGNSNFFNISSNIISGNYLEQVGGGTVAGIHVLSGTHGVIHNNSIYSNSGYGISIGSLSAQNIGVYWNEIGWNGVANALDGGTANIWDDDNATGNAWSDYSGSGTYPISMSSSEDRYPSLLTDSTTPTVDSPSNEVFEAGTSGNEIVWHASDDYPGSFVVYQNESVIVNRTWCFDPIEVELDPLDVGTHNLTIVVYDGAGHFVTDMVLVDAVDTISPTIDSPNDIEYVAGSTGNNIEWHGSDLFPASYEVFIDDVSTESGPWTSSTEPITVIVDGLTAGEHNCTIVLTDQGGNSIMDTVIVVVTEPPTTPPPTTTTPPPPPDGDGTMIVWLGLAVASVVVVLAFVIIRMRR